MSNRSLTLMMGFVAFLILAVGAVFVVVLATAGGDDDSSPAGGGDSEGNPTPRPRSTSGDICTGDVLITWGSDPASILDPIQVRDEGTAEYVVEIFGGLVTTGLDLAIIPDIAESWQISTDRKTYVFRLRDNVVFHNGRRVTAQDFKYSIERAADPRNNSPTVVLYLGLIEGLRDRVANRASDVKGVRVIDERTVEIKITQPADYFLAELSQPVAYVVDERRITQDARNWTRRPNGTGPFKLAEFTPADKVRLVRNDRYHLGAPKLAEVVIQLSGGSISTRFQNNELHIGAAPVFELEAIKSGSSPLSKEYVAVPRMATSYFAFNVNQPPFDDPKVRQAMALAIDKENINNVLLFDSQRVATGIIPPDMPGFGQDVRAPVYDVEAAKRLLAESKYAGRMPRIILTYAGSGGDPPDVLAAIQDGWRQALGLNVELQAVEYSAFLRDLRTKRFQMFSAGWIADFADPENFVGKLFYSDSPQNEINYNNPRVDALVDQARLETDKERRFALYRQAEQIILDDAVIIPSFWFVDHMLVKGCVKNFPTPAIPIPRYRFAEIAK